MCDKFCYYALQTVAVTRLWGRACWFALLLSCTCIAKSGFVAMIGSYRPISFCNMYILTTFLGDFQTWRPHCQFFPYDQNTSGIRFGFICKDICYTSVAGANLLQVVFSQSPVYIAKFSPKQQFAPSVFCTRILILPYKHVLR